MNQIKGVRGIEILDSRGNPTVEAEVILESGVRGRAAVRSLMELDCEAGTTLQIQNPSCDGSIFRCTLLASNRWMRGSGIAKIAYDATFHFEG